MCSLAGQKFVPAENVWLLEPLPLVNYYIETLTIAKNLNKYTTEELSQAIVAAADELGYLILKR